MICLDFHLTQLRYIPCIDYINPSKVLEEKYSINSAGWDYPIKGDAYNYLTACEMNAQGYYNY